MKLKELLIENTILLEGFRDLLRKFISAENLGDYYYEEENGDVVILTHTKKLDGYTVEDLENALADINYEYIYIDANGREDKNATRGTRADIKIISQVNW